MVGYKFIFGKQINKEFSDAIKNLPAEIENFGYGLKAGKVELFKKEMIGHIESYLNDQFVEKLCIQLTSNFQECRGEMKGIKILNNI